MTEPLPSFDNLKSPPPRPDHRDTRLGEADPGESAVVETLRDVLGGSEDWDRSLSVPPPYVPRRRRVALPLVLFAATCVSTFFAGATDWQPLAALWESHAQGLLGPLGWRQLLLRNWEQGLTYMGCVLAILMAHEMGHFVATLIYRVPASLPYFIPFPIAPIGTMGAVIGMEGQRANRRGIFDIGLAGPLAGLLVAAPILWWGVRGLDFQRPAYGMGLHCPLLMEWMIAWLRPEHAGVSAVRFTQLNPCFMAGWVGLLITGLNMLPISQLDGGHVVYALLRSTGALGRPRVSAAGDRVHRVAASVYLGPDGHSGDATRNRSSTDIRRSRAAGMVPLRAGLGVVGDPRGQLPGVGLRLADALTPTATRSGRTP